MYYLKGYMFSYGQNNAEYNLFLYYEWLNNATGKLKFSYKSWFYCKY